MKTKNSDCGTGLILLRVKQEKKVQNKIDKKRLTKAERKALKQRVFRVPFIVCANFMHVSWNVPRYVLHRLELFAENVQDFIKMRPEVFAQAEIPQTYWEKLVSIQDFLKVCTCFPLDSTIFRSIISMIFVHVRRSLHLS